MQRQPTNNVIGTIDPQTKLAMANPVSSAYCSYCFPSGFSYSALAQLCQISSFLIFLSTFDWLEHAFIIRIFSNRLKGRRRTDMNIIHVAVSMSPPLSLAGILNKLYTTITLIDLRNKLVSNLCLFMLHISCVKFGWFYL